MSKNIVTINNIDYDLNSLSEEQSVLYHVYETTSSLGVIEYTNEALSNFIESQSNTQTLIT